MRLLSVSDLHYALPQFDWVVKQAPAYDVLVLAGDLLDIAGHVDLDTQILVVQKYLERLGQPEAPTWTVVSSGNHDSDEKTAGGEYVARWLQAGFGPRVVVDGANLDFPGVRVTVCPWWDGPETQAAMTQTLVAARPADGRPWVWIHHAPPLGCPVAWTGKKDAGDAHVRRLIEEERPFAVVSGHIHNAPFRSGGAWFDRIGPTWVFNAGRQIGPAPAHVVLDLGALRATYTSLEGVHDLALA